MKLFNFLVLFICLSSFGQNSKKISFYFENNKSELSKDEAVKLSSFIQKCTTNKYLIEAIVAYTDTVGTDIYNKVLANNRANFVADFFRSKQIQIDTIVVFGENYPKRGVKQYQLKEWRRVDVSYFIGESNISIIEKQPESDIKKNIDLTNNKFQKFSQSLNSEKAIALNVQFYGGTANMIPNSTSEIEDLFSFLEANASYSALIRGHVCCHDDMPLSVQRANVVYQLLIDKGISPKRLDFKGFSNTMPVISPEITEEDRQQNRRVDVLFIK